MKMKIILAQIYFSAIDQMTILLHAQKNGVVCASVSLTFGSFVVPYFMYYRTYNMWSSNNCHHLLDFGHLETICY